MATPFIESPEQSSELVWPTGGAVTVRTAEDYRTVSERLVLNKTFQRRVKEFFAPLKQKAKAAHQALCDEENKALTPALDDERRDKSALSAYDAEQERLRREEERRLAEEARRREEQRRLDEAAALEREGNATANPELLYEANELIAQPVETPVVSLAKTTPKVAGIVHRDVWKGECVNLQALIQAAAENPQFAGLLQPNTLAITQIARALKESARIPGVRVWKESTVAAGGR